MSYTIYKSTSDLIAQPGRSVSTFPSGLVRVEQTYLGLTANAATNRATLAVGNNMPGGDSSPCIDGLKIFPEVQEVRREDGYTEYQVCAYGRCNTSGRSFKSMEVQTVQVPAYLVFSNLGEGQSNPTTPVWMGVVVALNAVTKSVVVPATASNSAIPIPPADTTFTIVSTTFDSIKASLKGKYPSAQFSLSGLSSTIQVAGELKGLIRTGFGSFDEVSATVVGSPTVISWATINVST